ncbi:MULTISPECIES: MauE/DoxX family redox-associated membrane protein [unclassified Streptomyces]|uniref:MauE/DoxX family redox-associated membrane protein n=1 Tax=unclassified Streptomyces TaxID=2593676 RepID=UPI0005A7A390|nr:MULTISPECIES: MauE/DoxX family redox-associated membrane protein [unclassified Streptomyces]ODA70557.1 Methylamine utilization protein MauE [Streptomyces sp. AVP053U2]
MILRIILGVVLAAMALGQLASFDTMPAILTTYGVTSGAASTALAVALISAETVTAVWFLVRPRSRAAAPVVLYTAVAVVWAALAFQAFARGLALDNCGCFGTYGAQPLRWYVLIEDALMLLYAWMLWRGLRRARTLSPAARAAFPAARKRQENH